MIFRRRLRNVFNREKKKGDYTSNLTFEIADATNLPYANASFDVVLIANALHAMPEPEKAMGEIYLDGLRKNGWNLLYELNDDG